MIQGPKTDTVAPRIAICPYFKMYGMMQSVVIRIIPMTKIKPYLPFKNANKKLKVVVLQNVISRTGKIIISFSFRVVDFTGNI